MEELKTRIEAAFADRELLADPDHARAVHEAIDLLDRGEARIAEKRGGTWEVNSWLKQSILLYFSLAQMQTMEIGPLEFFDKIPPKRNLEAQGVRVVPPGVIRYGAHVERGSVVMPGYVNIGAYVGSGTMVDTWATVGSCAQVGNDVHLSGGVGLGGVLEPPGATPVIIEDGAFIGSRSIIVEGAVIEERAVLGAGTVITSSTPIIDVRGDTEQVIKGRVPAGAVVVPGTRPKQFPAGTYHMPCALIIGERGESTDRKTSLTDVLREFAVQV
jgi:2,3,4,5-tetrahydropyridine-2-carboxylate N-succinyltransferase